MVKKAVLTFIFGADKEILREPLVVDDGIRYVCVTDQPLKSDVWEIRREYFPFVKSDRDKVAIVKMQPFKFVDAEQVVTIDGSLQIKAHLGPLFDEAARHPIGLKRHPLRANLEQELPFWVGRGMPKETIHEFERMAEKDGLSLSRIPLFEGCVIAWRNTAFSHALGRSVLKLMERLGDGQNKLITNQCALSYVLKQMCPQALTYCIDQHKFFKRFFHNTFSENLT